MTSSDLIGSEPLWREWLEPICIGCGSADFSGGVDFEVLELQERQYIPNIAVTKPSRVVTKPNIYMLFFD